MLLLLLVALLTLLLGLSAFIAWEAVHPPQRATAYALARDLPTDPSDLGLTFESWSLDRPDGVTLAVWDVPLAGATTPEASDAFTLILLHGWGRSRVESLGRIRSLIMPSPGTIGRVLLVDLRGHGESSGATSRLGDGEDQDVLALLDAVGDERVLLAGHSMGGVISILAAASEDPRARCVRGVLAWGPYVEVHVPIRNRLAVRDAPARPLTDLALLMLRVVGIRRRNAQLAAASLRCPLLVVEGAEDDVSPPDGARAIADAAPRGTVLEIPAAGHVDAHLVDPDAHDRAVAAWLHEVQSDATTAEVGRA